MGIEGKAHLPAPGPDEADVKFGVVGRQRAIPHKLQKTRQGLLQLGSVGQHGIRDARPGPPISGVRRRLGLTKVWNRSATSPLRSTTAPISVMASRSTFRPVVSMSKHTISSAKF